MGLLSGSTFRGIVGGIASAYVDRREEAKKNIEKYQTQVKNRVEKINEKKENVFKEFEADMTSYNALLQTAGSNLKPNLDSYLMTKGIEGLINMNQTQLKNTLNNEPVLDEAQDFAEKTREDYKIESDNLTQSLQDEVGIFKNQGTLFTKSLYDRATPAVQRITETVDDTRPLTRVSAAQPEGLPLNQASFTSQAYINSLDNFKIKNFNYDSVNKVYTEPVKGEPKFENFNNINMKYEDAKSRGFEGSKDDYFSEYQFTEDAKAQGKTYTPTYNNFVNDFLPNSLYQQGIEGQFNDLINKEVLSEGDVTFANNIINEYLNSSSKENQEKGESFKEQLDLIVKDKFDEDAPDTETPLTAEKDRVEPRPKRGDPGYTIQKVRAWDRKYGGKYDRITGIKIEKEEFVQPPRMRQTD